MLGKELSAVSCARLANLVAKFMNKEVQISALVSQSTKDLLELQSRATGVKRVHTKIVVSAKSGRAMLQQVSSARTTKALRELTNLGAVGK
jgi:hypothetical protein